MINFRHLISPECIILQLDKTEHEEVVLEMIEHLSEIGKIASKDCYRYSQAVMERESQTGTGLGAGIAIPHARVPGLKEEVAVYGRSGEGVDFESPDQGLAHHVCLLLVPEDGASNHLKILRELAKVFSQADLREKISSAQSANEISELLCIGAADL